MTCDVCLNDRCIKLLKRLDDPENIWYCSKCSLDQNKRILKAKNKKNNLLLPKRVNGNT